MNILSVGLNSVFGRIENLYGATVQNYIATESRDWLGCTKEQAIDMILRQAGPCCLYLNGKYIYILALSHNENTVTTLYIPGLREQYMLHNNLLTGEDRQSLFNIIQYPQTKPKFDDAFTYDRSIRENVLAKELPWDAEYNMIEGSLTKFDVIRIPTTQFINNMTLPVRKMLTQSGIPPRYQDLPRVKQQVFEAKFPVDIGTQQFTITISYKLAEMYDRAYTTNIILRTIYPRDRRLYKT